MGLTRWAVNIAVKNEKIESFENFLFIGPHPDDIEIGAGATISKLVQMKKHITFLICTDGRFGFENLSTPITEQELINVRKDESIKSANILGVNDVRFLNLSDGNQYDFDELARGIADVINDVKPDVIFAPDPDVASECHRDHLNVGNACKELANFANYKEIFAKYLSEGTTPNDINVKAICLFMTAKPNKYVRTSGHLKKQLDAISCHISQYPDNHPAKSSLFLYLKLRAIEFGIRRFARNAEGFRMMNRTRMHCLPESSVN